MTRLGVRACRRAVVTRLFAVWLVALAISPFTAPFSAIDQPISAPAHGEFISAAKLIQDEAPVTALPPDHVLSSAGVVVYLSQCSHPVDLARSGPLVLRL
jgi:hypothetical protein